VQHRPRCIPGLILGADDDIQGWQLVLMQPEGFADDPPDPVALD
jgi:hypothetical protein